MPHKSLRAFLRKRSTKNVKISGALVIHAKSFLRYSYEKSGCKYILGGEYDRYANYLRSKLKQFRNITCYVIYNAAYASTEIAPRLEWHQKRIENAYHINEKEYTDVTAFQNEVCQEVMDELSIKYLISENSREAIVTLAKQKRCPVLTSNFEFCLYGVSCVTPISLNYDENTNCMTGDIYSAETFKKYLNIHPTLMGIFLTFTDEESPAYTAIPQLTKCNPQKPYLYFEYLLRWIQRKTIKKDVLTAISQFITSEDYAEVITSINKHDKIFNSTDRFASSFFSEKKIQVLKNTDNWFTKGIASGIIRVPFINLKKYGYYSGSRLVADHEEEDAMLPAINIVFFAQELLSQSECDKITFIGRKGDSSEAWEIKRILKLELPEKAIFRSTMIDMFKYFLENALPGFRFSLLRDVPEESWIVIISLVYYLKYKVNKNKAMAYAVLLSYVMVGPVTEEVGLIKWSRIFSNREVTSPGALNDFGLTREDCSDAATALTSWFYVEDIEAVFDRKLLHGLSEYQHCLQNMEYLNNLTGSRVTRTKFHKVYNGTFIYHAMLLFQSSPDPMDVVRVRLGNTTVFRFFERIVNTFEKCLLSVQKQLPL